MRVVFEGAAGERVEADVLNVGSGGLFIRTEKPLAVGKRLSLEVQTVADMVAWSALGRVVWTREKGTTGGAPGMGVKLIDVDDAVVALIGRLVDDRAPRPPGTGPGKAPARERTVLGLGLSQEPPAPTAPIIQAAPAREGTVLGIGTASAPVAARPPPRERSVQEPPPEGWDVPDVHEAATKETVVPQVVVPKPREAPRAEPAPPPQQLPALAPEPRVAIDLVEKKPQVEADPAPRRDDVSSPGQDEPALAAPDALPSEDSLVPAGMPRRRGGRWLLLFLLVIALAAAALYVKRDRVPWVQRLLDTWPASPPAPAPVAAPPSAPTATAIPTTTASPTASEATSATATPSRAPSAGPTPSKAPARPPPSAQPAAAPTKRPASDNPY